ncbi:flagellar basal body rod protein FlgF [Metapseudomonas otitidis]|uniref:flagellar basal body rod protein FlgF n=1 Tax=Metapseudomonas otitidis TaxID=319939 RepID=UPI0013F5AAB7|nr:flagellar basal body rod protein FlgF [Pseudomonas otitidis]
MDRLGYTAMTAANRTQAALDVRANNLANVSTPGFRADLARAEAVPVEGAGYDSRHPTRLQSSGIDLKPGPLMATGRDLDLAIRGPGLIAVQLADGREAYTRHGSLTVDAAGRLSLGGRPVLGEGGPLELPPYDRLTIGSDGTVSIQPRGDYLMAEVGRIKRVDAPPAGLRKDASGLLVTLDGNPAAASETVQLAAGYLEGSNVSAIEELTGTLSLSRLFETQVKLLKAADDLAANGNRMIRGA